jgi:hypothetical protein
MSTSVILTILFLTAVAGLFIFESLYQWIYGFAGRTDRQIISCLRAVDMEQLKDLLNLAEEGYLRLNLSPSEFRKEQQHRIYVVLEHCGRMSHNTLLIQQWANTELRKSSLTRNREVASPSKELNNACIEFRVHALITRLRLHAWLFRTKALPFVSIPFLAEARRIESFDLVYSYERIKAVAEKLGRACGSSYREQLAQGL